MTKTLRADPREAGSSDDASACRTVATSHTPGPWQTFGDDLVVTGSQSSTCMAIDCSRSGDSVAEDSANARLVAAAPDMYAALKAIDAELGIYMSVEDGAMYRQMMAAIAKAEGR